MYKSSLFLLPIKGQVMEFQPALYEPMMWILPIVIALLLKWLAPNLIDDLTPRFRMIAKRRLTAVILTGFLAVFLRVAVLPWAPIPSPEVHDEFSYLLQADTFVHGRLTNPVHPMWKYFEAEHINQVPSYQSMYLPGRGVVLALGEVLGSPWLGVLFGVAAMCAAVTWMLQQWMPATWALLGGLFCVWRFALFDYNANSYWGGALAALGGALALGAAGGLRRRTRIRDGFILALGLAVMAVTRSFEGLCFSIPVVIMVAWWTFTKKQPWRIGIKRVILPVTLVMGSLLLFLMYYNYRGTGSAFQLAYQLNWKQYHIVPMFLWQKAQPLPHYRYPIMQSFYAHWEIPLYYMANHDQLGLVIAEKLNVTYHYYLFPLLLLFVPSWFLALRSRKLRVLSLALTTTLVAVLVQSWHAQPHYSAPALCIFVALVLYGLRLLYVWKPRGYPRFLAQAIIISGCILLAVATAKFLFNPFGIDVKRPQSLITIDRPRIEQQLTKMGGKHLVLVRYRLMQHNGGFEWVYNSADIDQQQIVWARDRGSARNAPLLDYYKHRRVWVLEVDNMTSMLWPYHDARQSIPRSYPDPLDTLFALNDSPSKK